MDKISEDFFLYYLFNTYLVVYKLELPYKVNGSPKMGKQHSQQLVSKLFHSARKYRHSPPDFEGYFKSTEEAYEFVKEFYPTSIPYIEL